MNRDHSEFGGTAAGPKGVLLLLVLISLTLFFLLGVALLVNATRLRMAARTFSAASDQLEVYNDRAALDEALMVLLRGSQNTLPAQVGESILADRYGGDPETIATAEPVLSGWPTSPILTANIAGADARHNGRVLTLAPVVPGGGSAVSFRIVGAGSGRIYLSNLPYRPGLTLPTGTCRWLVNGRDFAGESPANEPWDGFTTGSAVGGNAMCDPWLARVELSAGAVAAVRQATYQVAPDPLASPRPLECDNDGDGVADGVWLAGTTGFLASRPSPRGGSISYRVSYLVLDLDGRLNVNAAGIPASGPAYPTAPPLSTGSVPLGMGYGPADIDVRALFPTTTWGGVVAGGTSSIAAGSRRRSPGIGTFSGRYGPNGVPGAAGDDTGPLQVTSTDRYPILISGPNAVADLRGRARMYMRGGASSTPSALTPTLTWSLPASEVDSFNDPYEFRLDASKPRPSGNVWTGTAAAASDNDDMPYTVGELERILRVNDPDAPVLAQRLAAALGASADAARLMITTDSWDTPAVTGSAAVEIGKALAGPPDVSKPWISAPPQYLSSGSWRPTNAWSPDVAAGLRFNINRPVLSGTSAEAIAQQQEYCKGLYTLVRTLGETDARRAAQWAVNVLDFRDADSAMTRFVYDSDSSDGWSVTGDKTGTVWGVERPEMVIGDTAAWRVSSGSSMFVSIFRASYPAVTETATVTGTVTSAVESVHSDIGNSNLLRTTGMTEGNFSVWQLRFGDDRAVVFCPLSSGTTQTQVFVDGSQSGTRSMALVGSSVGMAATLGGLSSSGQNTSFVISGTGTADKISRTVSGAPRRNLATVGGTFAPPATGSTCRVWLERLADPSRPNGSDNPYIIVDTAPVVVSESGATPDSGITSRLRRPGPADPLGGMHPLTAFWRQPEASSAWVPDSKGTVTSLGTILFQFYFHSMGMGISSAQFSPSTVIAGVFDPAPWFHWPNRPFVSHAELALVPADDANGMLRNYSFPTTSLANGGIGQRILDATIVPSRFAGGVVTVTVTGTTRTTVDRMRELGLHLLAADALTEAGQMSTWREPGKINVNTMPTGTGAADGILWPMLIGGTQTLWATGTVTTNQFTASGTAVPTPARSLRQMMSITGTGDLPPLLESIPPFIVNGTATSTPSTTLNPRAKNPFLALSAANRLANMATIRSNVFAVWITVETTDSSPGAPPTATRRLFAIIDRSVPVGYSRGQDLNVRDTIRLLRQLD